VGKLEVEQVRGRQRRPRAGRRPQDAEPAIAVGCGEAGQRVNFL
jgi:hypothetical protein